MQCCRFNVVLWVYAMHNMHLLNKLRHKHVGSEYSSFNGCYHSVGLGFFQGWFRIDLGWWFRVHSPHLCVGFLFLVLYPAASVRFRPPSASRRTHHTTCSHTTCPHTTCSHTTCPHQLVITQLVLTQLAHTQLVLTQLAHTQLVLTNLSSHNLSSHNLLTHNLSSPTCHHTTCRHQPHTLS